MKRKREQSLYSHSCVARHVVKPQPSHYQGMTRCRAHYTDRNTRCKAMTQYEWATNVAAAFVFQLAASTGRGRRHRHWFTVCCSRCFTVVLLSIFAFFIFARRAPFRVRCQRCSSMLMRTALRQCMRRGAAQRYCRSVILFFSWLLALLLLPYASRPLGRRQLDSITLRRRDS